jgi:NADPH:quinone reductase-like Zn-dependent oxidoreductase
MEYLVQLVCNLKRKIDSLDKKLGTFSTQLLKHMGCSVSGTCSSKHNTRMYSLGVDKLFDYKTNELEESQEKYDIVMDCVSGVNHTPQV